MLRVKPTSLPGVLVLEPRVFTDERGYFLESWNQQRFDEAIGRPARFVQDNHSRSAGGVLRGLHYQLTHPQEKLVRVVAGRVFDVAVDMRRSSPTLGKWVGVELSAENYKQFYIPAGMAHGFCVLSSVAELLYKKLRAPVLKRTAGGKDGLGPKLPSTDAEALGLIAARGGKAGELGNGDELHPDIGHRLGARIGRIGGEDPGQPLRLPRRFRSSSPGASSPGSGCSAPPRSCCWP